MKKNYYLDKLYNSNKPFIIYKVERGYDLFTDFSEKIVLNNKNINNFFHKINKLKKKCKFWIQVRDVQGVDDNPFNFEVVKKNIEEKLAANYKNRFKVILVPNITNICYGRGVGYKIQEIVLPEEIQKISATKIRKNMRDKGEIK